MRTDTTESEKPKFAIYEGSCGHYWDSTENGIDKCPVCRELAEAREDKARLDWLENSGFEDIEYVYRKSRSEGISRAVIDHARGVGE